MKSKSNFSATRGQHLYRHKSGIYYARFWRDGKRTWKSLKTELLSIAQPRLAKLLLEEQGIVELRGGQAASGSMTFGEIVAERLKEIGSDVSTKQRTKQYYGEVLAALQKSWPEFFRAPCEIARTPRFLGKVRFMTEVAPFSSKCRH